MWLRAVQYKLADRKLETHALKKASIELNSI